MKQKIKITGISLYDEYDAGDEGIISGYIRGGNDAPLAVVILTNSKDKKRENNFVLVPINSLEFVKFED